MSLERSRPSSEELAYAETKLRESGLLDGLSEATTFEATLLEKMYREWARRLAPYLRDGQTDVGTALRLYRLEHNSEQRSR